MDGLTQACGDQPGWVCEHVYNATHNQPLAEFAGWLVRTPLQLLLIGLFAFVINRIVRRLIRNFIGGLSARAATNGGLLAGAEGARTAARMQTLGDVLRSLATVLIYGIATLMALGQIGVNLGPLIAGAGIAGVAIGFGAQSLVKDFLTGFFMLVEDEYGVGDTVDLGEVTGVVEAVNLRSTSVRAIDGTMWYIPNGEISRVGNRSRQWSRAFLDISVHYDTDIDHASDVIERAAREAADDEGLADDILEPPEVWGVESLADGSVTLRLAVKTRPTTDQRVVRALRRKLKPALAEAGIAIPDPVVAVTRPT